MLRWEEEEDQSCHQMTDAPPHPLKGIFRGVGGCLKLGPPLLQEDGDFGSENDRRHRIRMVGILQHYSDQTPHSETLTDVEATLVPQWWAQDAHCCHRSSIVYKCSGLFGCTRTLHYSVYAPLCCKSLCCASCFYTGGRGSEECKVLIFCGSDLLTRMLCSFCPPTIWAISPGFCRNHPESSADKMYRACERKDQILEHF